MRNQYYAIEPCPKPRMTQRNKWHHPPEVQRYFAFRDEVRLRKVSLPDSGYHLIFHLPMPMSWSAKKKELMRGTPHQQRPDKDNLEKALLDALYEDDSHIWDGRVTKLWAYEGAIEVKELDDVDNLMQTLRAEAII